MKKSILLIALALTLTSNAFAFTFSRSPSGTTVATSTIVLTFTDIDEVIGAYNPLFPFIRIDMEANSGSVSHYYPYNLGQVNYTLTVTGNTSEDYYGIQALSDDGNGNANIGDYVEGDGNTIIFTVVPYVPPSPSGCTMGICTMITNASSTFAHTVGFTPASGVKFAGDNFIKPIIGGGVSLLVSLIRWIIALVIIYIIIYFAIKGFKMYGQNSRMKVSKH